MSKKIYEDIIVENFLTWERKLVNQVQEAQRVPYRINARRNTLRHIRIKSTNIKHKEWILKAAREKQQVTYKGNPIWLTADLSAETLQARREWQEILKAMEGKNLQPRSLYLARISFKNRWRNKKLFRQAKVKRIQHKTSLATNTKGTSIASKHKRKERPTKTNPKQSRECK